MQLLAELVIQRDKVLHVGGERVWHLKQFLVVWFRLGQLQAYVISKKFEKNVANLVEGI